MKIKFVKFLFVVLLLPIILLLATLTKDKPHNRTNTIPVLCYHSIGSNNCKKNSITISSKKFESHLKTIKDLGYTTLTINEFNNCIEKKIPFPKKSVLITFDDGYEDNYRRAIPILKKYKMNATFFVISSYINKSNYMSDKEIRSASNSGFDIQSHTVSHKELNKLNYNKQLIEIKNSKNTLEKLINKPIYSIAYPVGCYNKETLVATKKAGYKLGFTVNHGYTSSHDSQYELNRICIDYTYGKSDLKKVLKGKK